MNYFHVVEQNELDDDSLRTIFVLPGAVCQEFKEIRRIRLVIEELDKFQLNNIQEKNLEPIANAESFEKLNIRAIEDSGNLNLSILVFTESAYEEFQEWKSKNDFARFENFVYLLVPKKSKIRFVSGGKQLKDFQQQDSQKVPKTNLSETIATVKFYLRSLTRDTKFGFFWIGFRSLSSAGPIIFTFLLYSNIADRPASLWLITLNLSLFSFLDGGIKHGVRAWRRLRKFDYNESKFLRLLFLGLVGLPEAITLLFISLAISLSENNALPLFKILLIWITSVPFTVLMGGLLGLTVEAIAKRFWDVKFLVGYIRTAILFSTPVFIFSSDRLIQTIHDWNPIAISFYQEGGYVEQLSLQNVGRVVILLLGLFALTIAFFKRVK